MTKRTPVKRKVTSKEIDGYIDRIKELEKELDEYEQFAVGIRADGSLSLLGDYTIFTLEEGIKYMHATADQLKRGLIISPNGQQPPDEMVEEEV